MAYYYNETSIHLPMPDDFQTYHSAVSQDFRTNHDTAPLRLIMPEYTDVPSYQRWPETQYAPPLPPKEPIVACFEACSPCSPHSALSTSPTLSPHSQTGSWSLKEFSPRSRTGLRTPITPAVQTPHLQFSPTFVEESYHPAPAVQDIFIPPFEVKDPLHIGDSEIYSSASGLTQYTINRESSHRSLFLPATKSVLTIRQATTAKEVGGLRFHSLMGRSIRMSSHSRQTTLTHQRGRLWIFRSLSAPSTEELKRTWCWNEDSSTAGGAILEDGAEVLAWVRGEVLTFEKAGLNQKVYDEIVLSAVAVVEARRRRKQGEARLGKVVSIMFM